MCACESGFLHGLLCVGCFQNNSMIELHSCAYINLVVCVCVCACVSVIGSCRQSNVITIITKPWAQALIYDKKKIKGGLLSDPLLP